MVAVSEWMHENIGFLWSCCPWLSVSGAVFLLTHSQNAKAADGPEVSAETPLFLAAEGAEMKVSKGYPSNVLSR